MEHNVSTFNKDLKFTKVSNCIINVFYCGNCYWIWLAGSEGIFCLDVGVREDWAPHCYFKVNGLWENREENSFRLKRWRQHKFPELQDAELFLNTLRAEHLMCSYLIWHLKDLDCFHHEIYAENDGFHWKFHINTPTQWLRALSLCRRCHRESSSNASIVNVCSKAGDFWANRKSASQRWRRLH